MNYQIEWSPSILRRFTEQWSTLSKSEQRQIMDALDGIDYQIMHSPMESGESRVTSYQRVLVQHPVSVIYVVNPRLKLVRVIQAQILS